MSPTPQTPIRVALVSGKPVQAGAGTAVVSRITGVPEDPKSASVFYIRNLQNLSSGSFSGYFNPKMEKFLISGDAM
jgi:hypothetical protein